MDEEDTQPRLLIVDDTSANIDVLVQGLRDEFKLNIALNGETALRSARENPPDLILLDIMMPGMDGYEVCQKLKENEATKDIPVIFVTALGEVEDETKGFETGAVDYVHKPISIPIVKARVKTHLALRQARQTLEKQNQELIEAARLREDVERMSRHDLKQPLTSIIGMPQLVKLTGKVSDEQSEMLDKIVKSGYRMLNMINLSLDLYKMETKTYQLQAEKFDALSVLRKVIEEASSAASAKKVSFSFIAQGKEPAPEDTFEIFGEEMLTYSMFSNIIKNAVEASPTGGEVSIALDRNERAVISIHNTGAIAEEIRDRFFDKYVSAGKKTGTGLGAYSARLMAET